MQKYTLNPESRRFTRSFTTTWNEWREISELSSHECWCAKSYRNHWGQYYKSAVGWIQCCRFKKKENILQLIKLRIEKKIQLQQQKKLVKRWQYYSMGCTRLDISWWTVPRRKCIWFESTSETQSRRNKRLQTCFSWYGTLFTLTYLFQLLFYRQSSGKGTKSENTIRTFFNQHVYILTVFGS